MDISTLSPEMQAIFLKLKEENAQLKASAPSPRKPYLQVNGFCTVPKGGHQDWIGQSAEVTITQKVRLNFGQSKAGNACARVTFKVLEEDLVFTPSDSE